MFIMSLQVLHVVSVLLQPIMPDTAAKIAELIKKREKPSEPLFGRK
jgi:methionyl-tRNA synthetase